MFYIAPHHTQSYIKLRKIAFSVPYGYCTHVPHDEKTNHICFNDGQFSYEVKCNEDDTLEFHNYQSDLSFTLSWDVGSIFFKNALVNASKELTWKNNPFPLKISA